MPILLHIADRALNRPLMIHPDKLPLIVGVLQGRLPVAVEPGLEAAARERIAQLPARARLTMRGPNPTASRFVGEAIDAETKQQLPYQRTRHGVALIPVIGGLVNRGAWLGSYSGMTSYEGIKFQVQHAADDPRTTAILLDIDSPGGEAIGAFECAEAIRLASTTKPVTAVVNGMAASAAYGLAAAASRVVVTETGVAGSIGVVMVHADYSRFLDQEGITPTLIFAGAHKVDGHPFAPLSAGVRDDLQAEVDQFYALFVRSVAAGRQNMTEQQVRATEARVYIGRAAVDAGLADAVGTFETGLDELTTVIAGGSAPAAVPAPKAEAPKPIIADPLRQVRIVEFRALPQAIGKQQAAIAIAEAGLSREEAEAILPACGQDDPRFAAHLRRQDALARGEAPDPDDSGLELTNGEKYHGMLLSRPSGAATPLGDHGDVLSADEVAAAINAEMKGRR